MIKIVIITQLSFRVSDLEEDLSFPLHKDDHDDKIIMIIRWLEFKSKS